MITLSPNHYVVLVPANGDHPFTQLVTNEPNHYVLFWPGAEPVGVLIDGNCPPERLARMVTNGMESIALMANGGAGFLS